MTIHINFGPAGGGADLPAWLQAGAAFIAVGVTAWQWWSAKADARREKKARQMAGFAVFMNVHAALSFQAERLARVRLEGEERDMGRYAAAMLESGFDLMERMVQGIQVTDLPTAGVEAVMSGQSAVHGARQALEGMAELVDASAVRNTMGPSVEYLLHSLAQLKESAEMLKSAVEGHPSKSRIA